MDATQPTGGESAEGMGIGESGELELLAALGREAIGEQTASVTPKDGNHAPSPKASKQDAEANVIAALQAPESTKATEPEKPAEQPAKTEAEAEPSRYEKAKERASKEWERINAEKAKLEADRKALEQQRQAQATTAGKYTPEDYEALAKEFEDEGRDDLAKVARSNAGKLREENQRAEAEKSVREFESKRNSVIKDVVQRHPDLLKPESEHFRMTEALLKTRPELAHFPHGFEIAAEAVASHIKARNVDALTKEVGELKQQLAQRDRLLQPGLGGPSAPSRATDFNSLSEAEQENRLLAVLRGAEEGGVVTFN